MSVAIARSLHRLALGASLLALVLFAGLAHAKLPAFDAGRLNFAIQANGLMLDYRVFGLYLLPGETLAIRSAVELQLQVDDGKASTTAGGWDWEAPDRAGLYPLQLLHDGEVMRLNVFVLQPATRATEGWLDHYRIGEYPEKPFRGLDAYLAPRGFVEVTPSLGQVQVSPHFQLGQFLCKQASDWPKYLALRPELLIKLERILEQLNARGIATESREIMSGFRTPWYNRTIGNRTSSSRHLFGGAADIFVDVAPRDGLMDDLNGDGRVSKADADFLYDLIEGWTKTGGWQPFRGGLASYRTTPAHGPFVHVDARGYRARWGR